MKKLGYLRLLGIVLLSLMITVSLSWAQSSRRQVGWAAILEDFLLFGATAWVYWREGMTGQEKGVKPVPVSPGVT